MQQKNNKTDKPLRKHKKMRKKFIKILTYEQVGYIITILYKSKGD